MFLLYVINNQGSYAWFKMPEPPQTHMPLRDPIKKSDQLETSVGEP